jgi:outer membrane receptor for Fe3+-dicitrate
MNAVQLSKHSVLALAILSALSHTAHADEAPVANDSAIEEVTVVGRSVSYANNATDETMLKQQTNLTSVLASIDNLPGVLINEGDTFGADDWSTSISIRGFQVDLSQQQIGMTVDGIANGNSNYGGGSKANRYIDTENLRAVEVSQGTADISSRSNEALGGTLNFTTIDPGMEEKLVVSSSFGEFDAQKLFVRYETGEIIKNTYAWLSVSSQESSDWMDQAAENTRDHFAAKIISHGDDIMLTGYISYDDTHEDNYQRIYGITQFKQNPDWDGLTSDWTGIPYTDQAYRRGWSTLRENLFAYLSADMMLGDVDVHTSVYYHKNEGRGDWIPPYIVDVTDDGEDGAQSELTSGNTVYGGNAIGSLYFVDSSGVALAADSECTSSIFYPYGQSSNVYDPACYDDSAIAVGSYRHTNYGKERVGFNGDLEWITQINDMENVLRAGVWYEDYNRDENRSWHKIIDSAVGYEYDHTPYWIQYSREFPVETLMYYLEDEIDLGVVKVRLGAKQFNVDVEKHDLYDASNNISVNSDSDVLFSAGLVAPLTEDIELFGGFSQNFAAIKDAILERDDADLSVVEPETADNLDLGLRYSSPGLNASLTYYSITFDNRILFVSNEDSDGIDYLESSAGRYENEGGIESSGIEASLQWQASDALSVYVSYTHNDSELSNGDTNTYVDELSGETFSTNKVIGAAEDMAVLSLDWQRNHYIAGLSTKYVGERFAGSFTADDYTVSDLYVGVNIDDIGAGIQSLDIRFTVNNLFDESYLGTITSGAGWLGAPRTAAINLKAAF